MKNKTFFKNGSTNFKSQNINYVLINNNKVFFYLVQTSIKRDFYSLSQKKFERFNSMKERFNDINSHHICLNIVEGSWPVKFTLIHSYEYV